MPPYTKHAWYVCVCVVGDNECLNIMHVILMKEINLEARTEKESDEKKNLTNIGYISKTN